MKEKFLADSMLGRLAKWLRVLGYDTVYLRAHGYGSIEEIIREGRFFLSREKKLEYVYNNIIIIDADCVKDQLAELKKKTGLAPDRSHWFTRCLMCNTFLKDADPDEARNNVPEYVFYSNLSEIRFCPSCVRYYWQGSHRKRMARQLEEWGFV